MSIFITDYISKPDLESKILSGALTDNKEVAEVLLVWHQKIDEAYLNQFPKLKGIVRYGVGFDMVDFDAVKEKGVVFCNTPDYGTDEVSDTAIAMIMNIARGVTRYDYFCRDYQNGSWQENTLNDIKRTSSQVLGVIGAGRIGGSVLRKSKALGFQTVFFDPYKDSGYEKMLGVSRVSSLNKLLSISDIVSIHTPLTEETIGMVSEEFIFKMKDGASLINTARGEIISNLDIFIEPLKSGKLRGLGLDVLPNEPPNNCKLIQSWTDREAWIDGKVIINPHTSYYSQESYEEMRIKASKNAKRIIDGQLPENILIEGKVNHS